MGRVKIKKKSTLIDMTAMSDVTVLLLTFFMLTSTFLSKEPTVVNTPASISPEKVPEMNLVQVLVSQDGKVWITMNNDADSTKSNDLMRAELLDNVSEIYNEANQGKPNFKPLKFTNAQKQAFAKIGAFGVPLNQLGDFLDLAGKEGGTTLQDEWITGKKTEIEGKRVVTGIPINDNKDADVKHLNEFQMWMIAMKRSSNDVLVQTIKDGQGIAVKADQATSYETVHRVMDNLQTIQMNKFLLMTALKNGGEE